MLIRTKFYTQSKKITVKGIKNPLYLIVSYTTINTTSKTIFITVCDVESMVFCIRLTCFSTSNTSFQGSITSLHFGHLSYNSVFLDKIIPQLPQKFVITSCVLVLILAIIFQNCFHKFFSFWIIKHSFKA